MKKEVDVKMEDSKPNTNNLHDKLAGIDAKNLNDSEVSLTAVSKINNMLFEVIQDMKRCEFSDNQEIIKSRAFSRMFQSGHQMLSTHLRLLDSNQKLTKEIEVTRSKYKESIGKIEQIHKQKHEEFVSQLENLETQLKMNHIEKENLQIEINNLQTND